MTPPLRAGIASFAATCVALVFLIQLPGSLGWLLRGSAFYATAWASGFLHGIVFGKESAAAVGSGAFLAGAVFSAPVVVVTYGFALAGAPLVLAFAAMTWAGACCGGRVFQRKDLDAGRHGPHGT